jgi:hypothetical protein
MGSKGPDDPETVRYPCGSVPPVAGGVTIGDGG